MEEVKTITGSDYITASQLSSGSFSGFVSNEWVYQAGEGGLFEFLKPTTLKYKLLDENATPPEKAHDTDLGYDLFALEDVTLDPEKVTKVRTGIAVRFPGGYGALIRDRSSIATKTGVFVVAGVIDETYTGEIIVAFYNPKNPARDIKAGMKIAQMILVQTVTFDTEEVDDLGETDRGAGGFGSTGL